MKDWLSSTWEANWRSFQYFNFYRLILTSIFFVAMLVPLEWNGWFNFHVTPKILGIGLGYTASVTTGLLLSIYWQQRFNLQLSCQVVLDVLVVSMLMYAAGGVRSGLGILLVITLAAASLVGRGRLVLFYAALATLAVLLSQIYGVATEGFDPATIFHAGMISAGFFATAILARLLGQRVMINEDLARRRGEALENQILISQRVEERMQDGVVIVGKDGTIRHSNPVAQAMIGLNDSETPLLSIACPDLASALAEWDSARLVGSQTISVGHGGELQVRFERTASSAGEILVFLDDVERIKAQAQQLKLASLGRLTASIAHEIRNPLSAISHAGELLREERREDVQDRLLKILNDNVRRLDRIVKDILELGRQNQAQQESFRLDSFCADFVREFMLSESLDTDVVILKPSAPVLICFDRAHLHQVLWNLVSNGLRYSSRSSGAVNIYLATGELTGQVELHVIDDGPGISTEAKEQIFEPFFTTHNQGTGLGLFIARELCAINSASLSLAPQSQCGHFIIVGRNDTCQLPEVNDALLEK